MKIIFMGTPKFAEWALGALIDGPHQVIAAYSQPPRPAGRGHKITPSPVQQLAEKFDIPVFTPTSLKKPEAQEEFKNLNADIAVVAAYGLILPKAILDAPRLGCINIHASALPRWRGAAPIQRAILSGDQETGITFMQMDEGLDTGKMLKTYRTVIHETMTAEELQGTLAKIGAREINKVISDLNEGRIMPMPQDEKDVTYAEKLRKEEGQVDWKSDAHHIGRMVRALNPWPGVYFDIGEDRIKILKAELLEETGPAGKI
nr:methionyl-tRNA formyltransferase [Alphaproteobacteria bacterium]